MEDPKIIFFFLGVFVGAVLMLFPLVYYIIKLDTIEKYLDSKEKISRILYKRSRRNYTQGE